MIIKSVHVSRSCIRYCSPSQLCSSYFLPLHNLSWCFWGVGDFGAEHKNCQISNDWAESLSNLSIHLKLCLFWANYAFIRSKAVILYRVRFSFSGAVTSSCQQRQVRISQVASGKAHLLFLHLIDNTHLSFSGWQKISFRISPCFSKLLLDYDLAILQDRFFLLKKSSSYMSWVHLA